VCGKGAVIELFQLSLSSLCIFSYWKQIHGENNQTLFIVICRSVLLHVSMWTVFFCFSVNCVALWLCNVRCYVSYPVGHPPRRWQNFTFSCWRAVKCQSINQSINHRVVKHQLKKQTCNELNHFVKTSSFVWATYIMPDFNIFLT